MENSRPSVFWWILGANRSLWPTPMFLKTIFPINMNPPNRGAYSKPIMRRLCRGGGTSKKMSKFDLRGLWMVVFHFLVLPSMACPRTLSRIYLEIYGFGAAMGLRTLCEPFCPFQLFVLSPSSAPPFFD